MRKRYAQPKFYSASSTPSPVVILISFSSYHLLYKLQVPAAALLSCSTLPGLVKWRTIRLHGIGRHSSVRIFTTVGTFWKCNCEPPWPGTWNSIERYNKFFSWGDTSVCPAVEWLIIEGPEQALPGTRITKAFMQLGDRISPISIWNSNQL